MLKQQISECRLDRPGGTMQYARAIRHRRSRMAAPCRHREGWRRLDRGLESLSRKAAMADLGDPLWRGMARVEAGDIADNGVLLAQDGEHQMSTTISVDTMA
jgi:hypothetical protein